jgi:hypothetical protein
MLNQIVLAGTLGRIPKHFYSSEGNPLSMFSLPFGEKGEGAEAYGEAGDDNGVGETQMSVSNRASCKSRMFRRFRRKRNL